MGKYYVIYVMKNSFLQEPMMSQLSLTKRIMIKNAANLEMLIVLLTSGEALQQKEIAN